MPSLCLLCGAMLVRALSLWVTLQKDYDDQVEQPDKKTEKEAQDDEDDDLKDEIEDEMLKDKIENDKDTDTGFSVFNMGGNYLLVHLLGYGVMNSPLLFSQIGMLLLYIFVPKFAKRNRLSVIAYVMIIIRLEPQHCRIVES